MSLTKKTLSNPIVFTFLLLVLLSQTVYAETGLPTLPKTVIQHQAPFGYSIETNTTLEAFFTDGEGILTSRCYFRILPGSDFYFRKMSEAGASTYTCNLPTRGVAEKNVEYFFLVVNGNEQVIRSKNFILERKRATILHDTAKRSSGDEVSTSQPIFTESGSIQHRSIQDFPKYISIERISPDENYAHRVGLLNDTDCADSIKDVYIGGFQYIKPGVVQAIPGAFCPYKSFSFGGAVTSKNIQQSLKTSRQNAEEEEEETINVEGSDWVGSHYRTDFLVPYAITAVITQSPDDPEDRYTDNKFAKEDTGDEITIETTEVYGLYAAHHFVGDISLTGEIVVRDSDGEVWTTFYGPATNTSIMLADFVTEIEPEEPELPPLFIVDLKRDEQQPVVEEKHFYFPGLDMLLLGNQDK